MKRKRWIAARLAEFSGFVLSRARAAAGGKPDSKIGDSKGRSSASQPVCSKLN
jgi:hypothetical protein